MNKCDILTLWASLVAQKVNNTPAMWETWVRSLSWEDPLEKGTTIHSSILAWRSPWTEDPGRYSPWGCRVRWTEELSLSLSFTIDDLNCLQGGMIRENSTETCILPYAKQIASPGSTHETGRPGPMHWDDPEGGDGEGGERGFRMGNTCTPMSDSCQCMAKTTTIV